MITGYREASPWFVKFVLGISLKKMRLITGGACLFGIHLLYLYNGLYTN